MHDVVIVGGGPAGLYAAARLAGAGLATTLLEEHSTVGDPVHCTGVLSAEAFEDFGLSRRAALNDLTTARFWSPAGNQIAYSSAGVEAVVIDRRAFDRELFERAETAGVEVRQGARATSLRIEASGVTVTTVTGAVRARACVLACGANYALHRQVGLGMPRLFLNTAQIELPVRYPGDVEVHFGSEVAPKGFGWALPVIRGGLAFARVG